MMQINGAGYFAYPRSAFVDEAFVLVKDATASAIYDLQPNVRIVVDHIARKVVQPGMHLYRFGRDGNRETADDHPAADSLRQPNGWQGRRELLGGLVHDFLLYDDAYLWVVGQEVDERRLLVRVPPHAIGVKGTNIFNPGTYRLLFQDNTWRDVSSEEIIHWRGYSPRDPRVGVSRMETLRRELAGEAARQARETEFVRGGMIKGGFVERPLDAPEWSDPARERFETDMAARLRGLGAGRVGVLEEGMTFVDAGVTPKDAEMLRSRELSLAIVARVYGLSPIIFDTAIGGSSTGGIADARNAASEDVYDPHAQLLTETLDVQFLGGVYDDWPGHYFEFAPRQGKDLQKLYEAGSKATGGPFLTVNEWRRELNLPPVDGGDELVTPLNVARAGGQQPSPAAVGDAPDRGRPPEEASGDIDTKALQRMQAKLRRRDAYAEEHETAFRRHFKRQRRALEGKSLDVIDAARWDEELARDLHRLSRGVVRKEGALVAERMMGTFDEAQVENYLKAGAAAAAGAINAQTARDVRQAVERGEDAVHALNVAVAARAPQLGTARATQLVAFATQEAGKQNERPGEVRLKRWIWSGKANSRHASLAGTAVPLGAAFPNGAQYPGDPDLGPEQNANCGCSLDID